MSNRFEFREPNFWSNDSIGNMAQMNATATTPSPTSAYEKTLSEPTSSRTSITTSSISSSNSPSRLAFGSCNDQDLQNNLWSVVASRKPSAFVWGGDVSGEKHMPVNTLACSLIFTVLLTCVSFDWIDYLQAIYAGKKQHILHVFSDLG
jgi:hypothetical protein